MRCFLKRVVLIFAVTIVALASMSIGPSVERAIAAPTLYIAQSNGGFVENLVTRVQALFVRRASASPPAGRRKGGAGRGRRCPSTPYSIAALVPSWSTSAAALPNEISRIVAPELIYGTTILANPTFLVYMPYTAESARSAKLMVLDEAGHQVIPEPIKIELPKTPGIMSVQFPEVLGVGKLYNWYFSVVCDEQKPSRNPGVRGWIQRVEISQGLRNALGQTAETATFEIYARYGIWFESVSALANAYRLDQSNETIERTWTELLNGLGLAAPEEMPLADEPLVSN